MSKRKTNPFGLPEAAYQVTVRAERLLRGSYSLVTL
jgi:hypothetical protein